MYFDITGDYSEEFAGFYEQYIMAMDPDECTGDCSSMAITSDYSRGLYQLENTLEENGGLHIK